MAGIIFALIYIAGLVFSWFATCGLYYLLGLCFGFAFSWAIATGVWILWIIVKDLFRLAGKH